MMELQPIIMAAGRGSRMMEITYKCPRALLPIANIPSVCYPISMLEKVGLEEAIVVVPEEHMQSIQKAISEFSCSKMRLDFVPIPELDGWGTADSLRYIKDKIKSDVLIVSCDLVTDVPLHRIIDIYRTHSATLTMLLSSKSHQFSEIPPPGIKTKRIIERDIIGMDDSRHRLIFFSSEADLEETVTFRTSVLKKHPLVTMRSNLTDCHLYIMKRWLVPYLAARRSISSVKGELVPHLVRKQFSRSHAESVPPKSTHSIITVDTKPDVFSYTEEDPMLKMAHELSSWNDHHGDMDECYHGDEIRCYAYVLDDASLFCARANNLSSYCEINRQIPRHLSGLFANREASCAPPTIKGKSQIGNDCLLDTGVTVGDKVSIKRSIIGKHCVIGDRVKISNSVIMNHVNIAEGSVISGTVIASDAQIGEKSEIKDSIIGAGKSTVPLSKLINEVHTAAERMMEI